MDDDATDPTLEVLASETPIIQAPIAARRRGVTTAISRR
ncbi:hypothetical protein NJ7G_1506 [Natrinema sp. J7-2]|nr:hypothetical protein NJ7G_1506 [Natrinema sp. J7-2]